jgi:site-specific recombinase XerD
MHGSKSMPPSKPWSSVFFLKHRSSPRLHYDAGAQQLDNLQVAQGIFTDVARRTALLSDKDRKCFAEASIRWLRHTFATHAVADGAPLDVIHVVKGRASIFTIGIYVSADQKRLAGQIDALAQIRGQRREGAMPA